MAYGLNVYNTSNNIIINQDYTNYHLVSTGSITNGGEWPVPTTGEVLFIRAATPGAVITSTSYFATPTNSLAAINTGLIEYVLVKRSPSTSSSSFGLRVYQSDGVSIAFDSGRAPCKIVSKYTRASSLGGFSAWSQTSNQPFVVPTGRKRYISGRFITATATAYIDIFNPNNSQTFYHTLTWTSDMQQTYGCSVGGADYQGTLIILTIDI